MEWQQQAIVCRDGVDSGCRALDVARVLRALRAYLYKAASFKTTRQSQDIE